jgi:hypothetical protein
MQWRKEVATLRGDGLPVAVIRVFVLSGCGGSRGNAATHVDGGVTCARLAYP